jgi:hypothetical protein
MDGAEEQVREEEYLVGLGCFCLGSRDSELIANMGRLDSRVASL